MNSSLTGSNRGALDNIVQGHEHIFTPSDMKLIEHHRIEEIKKFIQKEFEKVTNTGLRLKEVGEIKVLVETSNRVKAMVKAMMPYEVLNLKDNVGIVGCLSCMTKIEEMDAYYKKLEKGKLKAKNDTRKKNA